MGEFARQKNKDRLTETKASAIGPDKHIGRIAKATGASQSTICPASLILSGSILTTAPMIKPHSVLLLLSLLLGCARQPVYHHDPIPAHEDFTLDSKFVNETRVINVWTPPGYADGAGNFPVLYMPDGGIGEDFPHIANTIAELVNTKRIPPIILVGIENTDRRRDLTGFSEVADDAQYCPLTDGAKDFRAFITEELFATIDGRYRTTGERGIIGESLAGLFVMETCLLAPGSFSFYLAMDPSLWWNDHYLVRQAGTFLAAFPDQPIRLWFAGSSAEDISRYTNELATLLRQDTPAKLQWTYSDEPTEQHHTIFRATKEKALIWALGRPGEE